jgi:predicted metal-dependent phosphoesterase TrpH
MLFELHCHSTWSDGKATPRQIVEYAKGRLDGIAITDHDVIEGSVKALALSAEGFRVISGMEVSSKEGHILGLDIRELVPRDLSAKETVERIHALGGLAIAAHPYDRWRKGVGDLIHRVPFDAVEVANGHTFGNTKNPVRECGKAGLPMVGGSDAHTLDEVGLVCVECEGDILASIRAGKTMVKSVPLHRLILSHGVGLVKRRIIGAL